MLSNCARRSVQSLFHVHKMDDLSIVLAWYILGLRKRIESGTQQGRQVTYDFDEKLDRNANQLIVNQLTTFNAWLYQNCRKKGEKF